MKFCHRVGQTYASCSPFRIAEARGGEATEKFISYFSSYAFSRSSVTPSTRFTGPARAFGAGGASRSATVAVARRGTSSRAPHARPREQAGKTNLNR